MSTQNKVHSNSLTSPASHFWKNELERLESLPFLLVGCLSTASLFYALEPDQADIDAHLPNGEAEPGSSFESCSQQVSRRYHRLIARAAHAESFTAAREMKKYVYICRCMSRPLYLEHVLRLNICLTPPVSVHAQRQELESWPNRV
jgi:hypothetical protein